MVLLNYLNFDISYTIFKIIIITFAAKYNKIRYMAENNKRGGKRIGAGRPSNPRSKVQIALKLDGDLNEVFDSPKFDGNRGQYINKAVREKMLADGYIKEVKLQASVTVNGAEYTRQDANGKSSCAQCALSSECWDLWHYATPCYGGFYTKAQNR